MDILNVSISGHTNTELVEIRTYSYNGDTLMMNIHVFSIAVGVTLSVLFVLALIGNASVLKVYKDTKSLRTHTNMWVISVIVCDLLIVVSAFPFVIVSSFAERYMFGDVGCNFDGFIVTFLGSTSIYLFTALSVYRYHLMFKGHTKQKRRYTRGYLYIGLCFGLGLFWGVCPLCGWGRFAQEGIGISCSLNWKSQNISDRVFIAFMYIGVLFIPLMVIVSCYGRVIFKVWSETRFNSAWIQKRRVKRDIKVTITVAITIASFLISWTPYAVVCMCESFFRIDVFSISPILVQLPSLMAKTACIWNPIVYVCHNTQFRNAFIRTYNLGKTSHYKNVAINTTEVIYLNDRTKNSKRSEESSL